MSSSSQTGLQPAATMRIYFENKEDMKAYIQSELARPGITMHIMESNSRVIHQADVIAAQSALHTQCVEDVKEEEPQGGAADAVAQGGGVDAVPEEGAADAVPEEGAADAVPEEGAADAVPEEEAVPQVDDGTVPEYNADGTYRNTGAKERYMKLTQDLGEGDKVKNYFIAHEFGKLKRNYSFETKKDPLYPSNYNTKIMQIYGTGYEKLTVSDEFWRYAIKEYEAHQRKRIFLGEERSNCFKRGAHHGWTAADRASVLINDVMLPPKRDFYKPAIH